MIPRRTFHLSSRGSEGREVLTTASCSFSSSICSSAAVRGRGCRRGPGPDSTGTSPGTDDWVCADCSVGGWGVWAADDDADVESGFTAFWFDGRMFNDGDNGAGGGGICCCCCCCCCWVDCRRDAASGRGDGGTELRSGIASRACIGLEIREMRAAESSWTCISRAGSDDVDAKGGRRPSVTRRRKRWGCMVG